MGCYGFDPTYGSKSTIPTEGVGPNRIPKLERATLLLTGARRSRCSRRKTMSSNIRNDLCETRATARKVSRTLFETGGFQASALAGPERKHLCAIL